MKKDFIKINDDRIRLNTIKKYKSNGLKSLVIYYNTSRYKIEMEIFKFKTPMLLDDKLNELDILFGVE
jgi:hypothetical protein